MQSLIRKLFFTFSSLGRPRWDTGITPPEVVEFANKNPPGRSLDLGCGTGTNVIFLAKLGWQAEGVDYIPSVIRKAKRKAALAGISTGTKFFCDSVLRLKNQIGKYDLILDMGCYHGLSDSDRFTYRDLVQRFLASKGTFMIYGMLAGDKSPFGLSEQDEKYFCQNLRFLKRVDSTDGSRPASWWWFAGKD
jgi:SAM-dependent methyltransferase